MPKFYIALVFIAFGLLCFFVVVRAETNINSVYHWAWNDIVGWIDHFSSDTIFIDEPTPGVYTLEGYAVSPLGYIIFDCNGPLPPDSPLIDCGSFPDWKTDINGDNGYVSGWAWNDKIGWIKLDCRDVSCPVEYGVEIDAYGYFQDWAWNDIVGWIDFSCNNDHDADAPGIQEICALSSFAQKIKVKTTWEAKGDSGYLISSILDTGREGGAALNSIIRQGSDPAYTNVRVQIASSPNESGPWDFKGPGCSTSESDAYIVPRDTSVAFKSECQGINEGINDRYFRYKVILETNPSKTVTPKVDDIILNWSR